jgi:hypothetical protein
LGGFRIKIAALFYGILTAVSIIWIYISQDSLSTLYIYNNNFFKDLPTMIQLLISAVTGISFGLLISKLSKFLVFKFPWAKNLHIEFRGVLGSLTSSDVMAFSLFSAIGEEIFFRGLIFSTTGIIISSLIFGLLHIGPSKKFLPWPFQAIIMGFSFAFLYILTGTILTPILAHFVINYQNLHFINSYDPSIKLPKSFKQSGSEI